MCYAVSIFPYFSFLFRYHNENSLILAFFPYSNRYVIIFAFRNLDITLPQLLEFVNFLLPNEKTIPPGITLLEAVITAVSLMPGYPTWFTLIVSNVTPVWQQNLFSVLAPRKTSAKVQAVPSALKKLGIAESLISLAFPAYRWPGQVSAITVSHGFPERHKNPLSPLFSHNEFLRNDPFFLDNSIRFYPYAD